MSGATFLETNGNLVRTPRIVREKMSKEFRSIEPKVFKMISAKTDIADAQYLAAATSYTFPMVVHSSPIVNALTTVQDVCEWKPKYVPMLVTYAQLGQLRVAINGGLFKEFTPPDLVREAELECQQQGQAQVEKLYDDIDEIHGRADLSPAQKRDLFITRVEHFTIQNLNRLEKMIHTCVIGEENIPFELCKTPLECPTIDVLAPNQIDQFWDLLVKFWTTKVNITNIELQKHSDVEPTQWITVEGLAQTRTAVPRDQMWKGYLTPKTAEEYYKFFTE